MANQQGATVIFLEDHPLWTAAQRLKRERTEAIRRHPSSLARQRVNRSTTVNVRNFTAYSSSDTPA